MKRIVIMLCMVFLITGSILAQINYSSQVQPIFDSKCVSCHGGTSGVTFTDYVNTMSNFGDQYGPYIMIVIPGDRDNSPLWDKINSTNPQYGSRMPTNSSLSAEELNIIGSWIIEGALPLTAVDEGTVSPTGFRLLSCYPNPFNPSTTVRIVNQTFAQINLAVYDVQGRIVNRIVGEYEAGYHDIPVDLTNQPSGMYVVLMQAIAGNRRITSQTQKMLLMK